MDGDSRSAVSTPVGPTGRLGASWALGDYRNLAAIVGGLAFMQAAVAALSTFAPLVLASRGEGAFGVGVAAAGYAGGFLVGALRAAGAVRTFGHIRTFAGFAALAAIATTGLFAFGDLAPWIALQACLGFCVSTLLTAGESWIADVAPTQRRGSLLAFYMIVSKIGQIAGPLAIASVIPGDAAGFMAIAGLFAASLVPVCLTRRGQPQPPSSEPFRIRDLWKAAPAAVLGALTAGAVNGAVLQLYSLYASAGTSGSSLAAAAELNGAIALGAVAAQWPAGWVSDRIDRRIVISVLAGAGCLASAVLAFLGPALPWSAVLVIAALWGAGSMSFYGVAVAHAADRATPGQATSMMAGILVVWAIGAIAGPLLAGLAMASPLGPAGLFAYAGAGLLALCLAMIARRVDTPAIPQAEKSPFAIAPATSTSMAQIDPRADDDPQLNLFDFTQTPTGDAAL
jgi:MFS family permease